MRILADSEGFLSRGRGGIEGSLGGFWEDSLETVKNSSRLLEDSQGSFGGFWTDLLGATGHSFSFFGILEDFKRYFVGF